MLNKDESSPEIVIRVKLFWCIVSIVVTFGALYLSVGGFVKGTADIRDYLILILSPIGVFAVLFYVPSLRCAFFDEEVRASWYLGLPWYKIWEHELFRLPWHRVDAVFNFLPWWIPITIIMVVSKQDGETRMFALGTFATHKKEALLFLAEHVRSDALGEEVEAMIARYRERV